MKKNNFKKSISFYLVVIMIFSSIIPAFADKSYRVSGDSMYPTIRDGEIVDIISKEYKENDIVIADVDGKSIIKRVKGDKLIGDNNEISNVYDLSIANIIGKAGLSKNQSNDEELNIAKASSNIPELTAYQKNNHVKLEWAVEMAKEDIIIESSFEPGENSDIKLNNPYSYVTTYKSFYTGQPDGNGAYGESDVYSHAYTRAYNNGKDLVQIKYELGERDYNYFRNGGGIVTSSLNPNPSTKNEESFTIYYKFKDGLEGLEYRFVTQRSFVDSTIGSTGNTSLKVTKTTPVFGNPKNNALTRSSNNVLFTFQHAKGIKNGTDLFLNFKVKSNKGATVRPMGHGGTGSRTYDIYGPGGKPLTVTKLAKKGDNKIYVSNLEQYPDNYGGAIYVASRRLSGTVLSPFSAHTIRERNVGEGYVVLSGGIHEDFEVGYNLQSHRSISPVRFTTREVEGNNEWTTFTVATKVDDNPDYDSETRGIGLYLYVTSEDLTYIDDIQFGYATKSEVYRDNTKIYEGLLSDFEDTASTDKSKPNAVSNVTLSSDKNILKVNYSTPTDNGTNYNYKIRGVANDVATPFSNIKPVKVTSGIKGYSYVIDTNPNTVPNDTVNTTSTEITKTITEGKTYYLHIKSIDNAGNASNVVHKQINVPHLTATPVPAEDYIQLDWNVQDKSQFYNYMIYQKREGETEFQTIPANERAKVLNLYPSVSPMINFTNWKGEHFSIPKSASVKMWMEAPNDENSKGYGKGLIDVDAIDIDNFNVNPNMYLKNSDGSWKYDVVFIGAWNVNNGKDITNEGVNLITDFIKSGRGYLSGHDTVWSNDTAINTRRFREYTKIKIGSYYEGNHYTPTGDIDFPSPTTYPSVISSNKVSINKKGLLTNYPWDIGSVGTVLTTPSSHTTSQFAYGDVWLKYANQTETLSPDGFGGTNNFYLTTWNNTAQIQTGHSGGGATSDEQKILANTLFYLSQITNENNWKDRTGQDVSAPNKPNIQSVSTKDNNSKIEIKYNAVEDNGTDYEYFVEATGANDNVKINSNIASATIKSGLKGYSIVVDNNPNTIPDNVIETTATTFILDEQRTSDFYVHVASVDKVGNISEVSHYHYNDTTKPTLTITHTPTTWTADYVNLHAVATDNGVGVQRIRLPNNNWVNGSSVNYRVISNGKYEFVARDFFGNETTNSISITNIDKTAPTSPSITNDLDWTNASQVPVTISSGIDTQSGVDRTEYSLSGDTTLGWTTYSGAFNIANEGVTKVTARTIDNLGHISDITTSNVRIDRTLPHATSIIINDNAVFSNSRSVTLTLSAMDSASGVDKMQFKNEDGSWSTEEAYKTSKAWTLSSVDGTKTVWVRYKDLAGNWSNPVKDTIELDMTAPIITKFTIQDDREYYNNHSVHLNLKVDDNLSGIKEVYISNDNVSFTKKSYAEKISWNLSSGEGIKTVYMKVLDNSGNMTSTVSDTIIIDTIKPTGSIVINNGNAQTMSRDVKLNISFSDNASGVNIVKIVENSREYVFPSIPNSPSNIDWRLEDGTGMRKVHLIIIDKAGNVSDEISDTIIVDKLSIERFTLTDVVNPILFNKNNSFIPKEWTFEPQDMLSGANISFSVELKKAYDTLVVEDSVMYKVEIIGSGYHKALTGDMLHQVADNYSKTVTLPEDTPKGAKVYVIATATRELLVSPYDIQVEYFPGVEATTKAQIGIIEGNIYEAIRFNETN